MFFIHSSPFLMTLHTLPQTESPSDIALIAQELDCDTSTVASVLAEVTKNPPSTISILEETKNRLHRMFSIFGPDTDELTGPEPHADYAEPEPETESGADAY